MALSAGVGQVRFYPAGGHEAALAGFVQRFLNGEDMNFHVIKIGEPLPGEGLRERRVTRLCEGLVNAGHQVTWWTTDWSHQKLKRRNGDELVSLARARGIDLRLIPSVSYHKNFSLRRLLHHSQFSNRLISQLEDLGCSQKPDFIWVCFPTVPVAVSVSKWARKESIPFVYDIRDLSPDIFIQHAPKKLRSLVELCARPIKKRVGKAFSSASGLVGVSRGYLDWAVDLAEKNGGAPERQAILPLGYNATPETNGESDQPFLVRLNKLGVEKSGINLVYAGSLGASYDLETVVRAVGEARGKGFLGKLLIAGGGEKEQQIVDLVKNQDDVHYLGWLKPSQLSLLLSVSSVGLMAYSDVATQGMPNKIYEYMGNGLMVLNSLKGEASLFVESNEIGLNYKSGDVNGLANILADLTQDHVACYRERSWAVFNNQFEEGKSVRNMVDFVEGMVR